ncbi:glycosyltransferase [Patescibacteria group bacterium]|nr:MAG: glycosyltransferase [Patescibacteria group bacterium]
MKSLAIKIGKALGALKDEGLLQGGRRIVAGFLGMFRRVGSGDILFITGGAGAGASALYRCHHQREELEQHGFECSFTVQDNPWLVSYARKFKVFIFHRPLMDAKMKKFVAAIKERKGKIIFETDDLLFDPQYLSQADYLKNISPLEMPLYVGGLGAELLNDPYVETCVTTTVFLAKILEAKGKQVFVSTNKLSDADLALAEKLNAARGKLRKQGEKSEVVIGYFSGTASHDKDFATVAGVLTRILEKHPEVKLKIVGPLKVGSEFEKFGNRVEHTPFVDRERHFQNVASVDINIAPLEVGNPFCEAKSELKFFGAGILGVPTIAAATQVFRDTIADGIDGFVAHSEEEWENKLEGLIVGQDLRMRLGGRARTKSLERYTNKNSSNEAYYLCMLRFVYGEKCKK